MTTEPKSNEVVKSQSSDVQKNGRPIDTIRELLKKQEAQIALALPKHLTPERFARVALTIINKTPKLAACTPTSLLACIMDCASLGLEPDGRRVHLIPYGDKCTMIIDYKGIVELVMRSGTVSNIHADVVCESDVFKYNLGQIIEHSIDFRKPRGEMYCAYVIITMKDGSTKCEAMTKEDIDSIRARSKASNSGPWVTDYNEMAKKTVFRRASKWVQLSPEIREKIENDDEHQFSNVPMVDLTPKKPLFAKTEIAVKSEVQPDAIEEAPAPAVETEVSVGPETNGANTKFLNSYCQEQKIEIGDLLNFLGEMGFATFEDVPDRLIENIKKRPETIANQIRVLKGLDK